MRAEGATKFLGYFLLEKSIFLRSGVRGQMPPLPRYLRMPLVKGGSIIRLMFGLYIVAC